MLFSLTLPLWSKISAPLAIRAGGQKPCTWLGNSMIRRAMLGMSGISKPACYGHWGKFGRANWEGVPKIGLLNSCQFTNYKGVAFGGQTSWRSIIQRGLSTSQATMARMPAAMKNIKGKGRLSVQRRLSMFTTNLEREDIKLSNLIRPGIFAAFLIVGSFSWAVIEEHRRTAVRLIPFEFDNIWGLSGSITFQEPPSNIFEMIKNEWDALSEKDKLVAKIIAVNAVVFFFWQTSKRVRGYVSTRSGKRFTAGSFMEKHFLLKTDNNYAAPIILSAFSHQEVWHLGVNMFVLIDFSRVAYEVLGKEQFLAFYVSAAAFSAFISKFVKMAMRERIGSLGASGAIMALVALMVQLQPDSIMRFIFLPFVTFQAKHLFGCVVAMDVMGLVFRWKLFDHAAHLAGALFGWAFVACGAQYVRFFKPLVLENYEKGVHWWEKRKRGN
eukprot:Nk52_evm25s236 gene=Nk52_evmTU25s236